MLLSSLRWKVSVNALFPNKSFFFFLLVAWLFTNFFYNEMVTFYIILVILIIIYFFAYILWCIPECLCFQEGKLSSSNEGESNIISTGNAEPGMVHIVSWMDCLDLRMLAVLVNSTLSNSRYVFISLTIEFETTKFLKCLLLWTTFKSCMIFLLWNLIQCDLETPI